MVKSKWKTNSDYRKTAIRNTVAILEIVQIGPNCCVENLITLIM